MEYSVPKLTEFSPPALDKASTEWLSALEQEAKVVRNESDVKNFRDRWMGRKSGNLTLVNDWLKAAPKENKREVGQRVNEIKTRVEQAVDETQQRIQSSASDS